MGHSCSPPHNLCLRVKKKRRKRDIFSGPEKEKGKRSSQGEEILPAKSCRQQKGGNCPTRKKEEVFHTKGRKILPSQTILAILNIFHGSSTSTISSQNIEKMYFLYLKSDNVLMSNILSDIVLIFVFRTFFYCKRTRNNPFGNTPPVVRYLQKENIFPMFVFKFHDYFELVFLIHD